MSSMLERRITHLAGHALPLRNKVRAILLAVDGTRCLSHMPLAPLSNLVCVVSWPDHDDAFNASEPATYAELREHITTEWDCKYTWIIVPKLTHFSRKNPTRAATDGPSPFAVRAAEFHLHLDECQQCRENPMKLCDVGAVLLKRTAIGASGQGETRENEGAGEAGGLLAFPDKPIIPTRDAEFTRVRDDEALDFKDTFIPQDGAK